MSQELGKDQPHSGELLGETGLQYSGRLTGNLQKTDDPRNWRAAKKWICTCILVLMTAMIAIASSIYSAAIPSIAARYKCSQTIATLGITTFLLGFGSGPLLFAPLSEVWGRLNIFRVTFGLFVVLQIACALAPNIVSLIIFRLLSGFFGSPAVTNTAGAIADIWDQAHRSVPLALFSAASFLGPVIAPTIGGFVSQYTTWRWNFWIVLILSGTIYVSMIIYVPETYAAKLEKQDGCGRGTHSQDRIQRQLYTSLTRPWVMLLTEPILLSLSLYMAFLYGILYLDFTAYPFVYKETRGWSPGIAGLSFLGMCVGMFFATLASPLINRIHGVYVRRLGGTQPEARLPHLIPLAWLLPLSLFWFAWTAGPPIHWLVGISSGIIYGFALIIVFLGITSYLTDCYGPYAASAMAANAVLRSVFGATFPLFANDMYQKLNIGWATSVLAFVALVMAPLPWVFYRFGPALRERSAFHVQIRELEQ
ncbi:MFS multidrug transporter [Xylogone sp. PMI_703]|nr:MFS multidrug transporter [Xylogone sp. PMI_703]